MALIPYAGFIGPANTLQSIRADDEDTINWYLEATTPGSGKVPWWLVPTPGLQPWVVLAGSPVRALFYQDGRLFAVCAQNFYEVFASQTAILRGTVALDGRPATISSNGTAGNQLFVTSGGSGYIFDLVANTLTLIADPDFLTPSAMGAFCDGYFLNLHAESRQFQFSHLEDGTAWDALDVDEVSQSSDDLLALAVSHREVWLFGTQTAAAWTDVGDANTPFQPIPGYLLPVGIAGRFCWALFDNSIAFIGQNQLGNAVVFRINGQSPQRISTTAVEHDLRLADTLADVICFSYQDRGHEFLVVYVPSRPWHWVYDAATQQWHKRALWDPTALVWVPWLGRCHTFGFGLHLIGDRQSGAIYQMDPSFLTDGQVSLT